jgi:predicted DNA-binding transcriptional regulator YafY
METQNEYVVVDRLRWILEILLTGPATARQIAEQLGFGDEVHEPSDTDLRKIRRDVRALQQLGFQILEQGKPILFSLVGNPPPLFTAADLQTLALIREVFSGRNPYSNEVQDLLDRLTQGLSADDLAAYQRKPVMRIPLNTAIDYQPYKGLLSLLERSIGKQQEVSLEYRPLGRTVPVRYARLEPYAVEYLNNHFYLIAFCHDLNYELELRLDRIVPNSLEQLPARFQGQRRRKSIAFTYRLPARFVENGVSERFHIINCSIEGEWAYIRAQGRSEFRIIRTLLAYGENASIVEVEGTSTLKSSYLETIRRMLKANEG